VKKVAQGYKIVQSWADAIYDQNFLRCSRLFCEKIDVALKTKAMVQFFAKNYQWFEQKVPIFSANIF
jgi:hypothetical protein